MAGVNQAADTHVVARLEPRDLRANLHDPTDDFVAGDDRISSPAPVVPRGVKVRVAHAAEEDLDHHIVGTRIPPIKAKGSQGVLGGLGGKAEHIRGHLFPYRRGGHRASFQELRN